MDPCNKSVSVQCSVESRLSCGEEGGRGSEHYCKKGRHFFWGGGRGLLPYQMQWNFDLVNVNLLKKKHLDLVNSLLTLLIYRKADNNAEEKTSTYSKLLL